jgi:hypothetical protein
LGSITACGRIGFDPREGDPAGLIARYPMDALGAATPQVVDATGHGHDGSCGPGACPLMAVGKVGGAYVFDGTDEIVRIASVAELETAQGFTVTAWFSYEGTQGCFVNKQLGPASSNSWQACRGNTFAGVAFYSSPDATSPPAGLYSGAVAAGTWHHLALWWDGATRTKKVYLDGVEDASDGPIDVGFDPGDVTIGADVDAGSLVDAFLGRLDEVRIYDHPLTDAELATLQLP